jgi:class 3 adenylate cyclase/tetratricopeptide (TPR) repeat protein
MTPDELLRSLGLEQYLQAFRVNAIDGEVLASLTTAELQEIGVGPLGHRKKILAAIRDLTADSASQPLGGSEPHGGAQHRQLTIMFADLVGSTQLSQQLDPEDLREISRAYQDAAKSAIGRFDGNVAKYMGDGVLAYFGYPHSHEDDAERAVRAGLALVEAMAAIDKSLGRDKGVSVAVRVGIETGPVVVGDLIGEGSSQEESVVGETPNLTARLQDLAEPNTVVVGPHTQALVGSSVEFSALGPKTLKGFTDPIAVWRVDGLGLAGGRFERASEAGLSRFIGRSEELGALAAAFSRVRSGDAAVVNVVGDPGIGKSRLIHEFLDRTIRRTTILTGHCATHGGRTTFFPFIDLIRRGFNLGSGRLDQAAVARLRVEWSAIGLDPTRHIPYLLSLLGHHGEAASDLDPDLIGVRTHEALIGLVRGIARRDREAVVHINDLHWIDRRSEDVIDALVRFPSTTGFLVLCTFRPEYEPPWSDHGSSRTVVLEPLSNRDMARLFEDRLGAETDDDSVLSTVLDRCAGIPLFVEELANHMRRQGPAEQSWVDNRRTDPSAIPDTLAGLLLQRADTLSPAAQFVLKAASVVGRRFHADVIAAICRPDDPAMALGELVDSGLILKDEGVEVDSYRFKHALVQDAIYGGLLGSDRRAQHRDIGSVIEDLHAGGEREVAEELAWHFELAEDNERAARYAYLAGEKAFDLFALGDADTWFSKVTALLPQQPDQSIDPLYANAVVNQVPILCWDARFGDMVRLAEKNLPLIEALGETSELSRVLAWLGEGYLNFSRFAEAEATLNRAMAIAETLADDGAIGNTLGELVWLQTIRSDGEPAHYLPDLCARLDAMAEALGDHYLTTLAHYGRWTDLTHRGRMTSAQEQALDLISLGKRTGYPPALSWGNCMLAYTQTSEHHYDEAMGCVDLALQHAQCGFDRIMADATRGILLAANGEASQAIAYTGRAQRLGDEIGSLFFAFASEVSHGRALAALGQRDEAITWLTDSLAFYANTGNRRAAAQAALDLGTLESAKAPDHLDRAIGLAKETGMDGVLAQAHLRLAEIATPADKALHLATAEATAAPLGWVALSARVADAKENLGVV